MGQQRLMAYYYQASFERDTPDGIVRTTGWVESQEGITVGARVTLKDEEGIWTVVSMCPTGVRREEFMRINAKSRTSMASLMKTEGGKVIPFKKD